jgi:hypothetical protein
MKSIKFLSIVITFLACFVFTTNASAQKESKPKSTTKPTKTAPSEKVTAKDDCIAATEVQVALLLKACDEMRFVSTQDAKAEKSVQKRCEKLKKIISGDALVICKLHEKVAKSKQICGTDKKTMKEITDLYKNVDR